MRRWARRIAWGGGGGEIPYEYYIVYPRTYRRWSMQGRNFMMLPLVCATGKAFLKEKHWMKLLLAPARCDTTRVP